MSGDGRLVAYTAAPPTADGRASTVWLLDRASGTTAELTVPVAGARLGDSVKPALSADGCVAVVVTQMALDLFRDDDTGSRWDVYRITLPSCGGVPGDWELVSAKDGGGFGAVAADDASPDHTPAVSGSGAVVAYVSRFSAATPNVVGVRVADLTVPIGQPGRNRPVAGTPTTTPNTPFRYRGLRDPSVSDDGLLVAFTSDAESDTTGRGWASGTTPGDFARSQVFVWDRTNTDPASAVVRVSAADGIPADGEASSPALSGDGRYVAFVSTSTNLVADANLPPCAATCPTQVYRYDRIDASIALVSRVPAAASPADTSLPVVAADHDAGQPTITSDGSEIAFVTRATNLLPTRAQSGGGVGDGDVLLADLTTGTLRRVSVLADGVTPAPATHAHPRLSSTGRVVVFDTLSGAAFGESTGAGEAAAGPSRQVAVVTQTPSLSLADLDVGSTGLGFPGPEWFVSLVNDGPSTFVPAVVESSDPQFAISGGTCMLGTPVPPGSSCTVNVMLTPAALGPVKGTLRVAEEGFGALGIDAALAGAGGGSPLAVSPAGVDLPTTQVGAAGAPTQFQVFNVGFGPLTVESITVDGDHAADVSITATTCRRAVLSIGESCTIDAVLTPSASGRRTATIKVGAADGEYATMLLSGVGVYRPTLSASAADVIAGSRPTVAGDGFAPGSSVTILWADGSGRRTAVGTDGAGSFRVTLLIGPAERTGERTLVAQAPDGTLATTTVTVFPPAARRGATSPAYRGG